MRIYKALPPAFGEVASMVQTNEAKIEKFMQDYKYEKAY